MVARLVIVGLGLFGSEVARALYASGHEVIAVDTDPQLVDEFGPECTQAAVVDAREVRSLEAVGGENADVGIISTGQDVGASVLIALALRDLGVKELYAERLRHPGILSATPLAPGFSLREIALPEEFRGKTLRELDLPETHRIQVVAVRDLLGGTLNHLPDPDAVLKDSDTLIVIGAEKELDELAEE